MGEEPKVGLGVIVRKEGKILLGKKIGGIGHGTWGLPWGYLDKFETFGECAFRQTDKVGIEIKLTDRTPFTLTEDFFHEENEHYITHFIRANYVSGEPEIKEHDKYEQWEWFEWDLRNLPQPLSLHVINLIRDHYNK
jgi:8-oxo-dGTP diphosphatase